MQSAFYRCNIEAYEKSNNSRVGVNDKTRKQLLLILSFENEGYFCVHNIYVHNIQCRRHKGCLLMHVSSKTRYYAIQMVYDFVAMYRASSCK